MNNQIEILEGSNEKKNKKPPRIITFILLLIAIFGSGYLIYNILLLSNIENKLRYIVIGIIILIDILSIFKTKKIWKNKPPKKKNKKSSKGTLFIIFLILYSIICFSLGYTIHYVYGKLDKVNKKYITYSSSLVVMKDNAAKSVKDIKDFKIAILKDESSPEGYIIPQKIIKENKLHDHNDIVDYETYTEMITDLYTGDVDAIFVASEYDSIYNSISGYENIKDETKIIISKEEKMLKSKTSKTELESTGKSVTEPFTILLMGIDSTDEVLTKNAVANGDSLILITFNPKTLNATMLSIPRDSYVPIACWPGKRENKITHAAAYGTDCMVNTIEQFFDVDIDYYAKINFKGLVNLVDAMGGIDVEVPQDLCTDDSNRGGEVCIKEGFQHLNGEEALVLSRNRKQLVNGDFGRGQNQQLVIQAMLQKIKSINSVGQFTKIFNTIANNLDTNLTTKQILSFYSVAKDIVKTGLSSDHSEIVNIQQLYLQGQSAMIYEASLRMELYNYVPNTHSRDDITEAMKTNLELTDHKVMKTFSFSINQPYEKTLIGWGPYASTFVASKYPKAPPEEEEKPKTEDDKKKEEKTKYGCTDKKATNYDKTATDDDGTCKYSDKDNDNEDEKDTTSNTNNNQNQTPGNNSNNNSNNSSSNNNSNNSDSNNASTPSTGNTNQNNTNSAPSE